jgi:hypothetical protein
MRRRDALLGALSGTGSLLFGCVGTTGGELFELEAFAAGPPDANAEGGVLRFTNSRGYVVELEEARLYVGGVYLNRSRQTSVSSDTSCTLPGIYVAQVLTGLEVDLLSAEPQRFPDAGFATQDEALTGEVWLSRGNVDDPADSRPILRVTGFVERAGQRTRFTGQLSIGQNRLLPATDAALPGAHPICKQRVVSPIPTELRPTSGRALLLRIDPRAMFANVDFATLGAAGEEATDYRFADEQGANQASDNLYAGMRRSLGVYNFDWMNEK